MEPGTLNDPSKHGEFSWRELMTADADKAFEFYHTLFGWEKVGTPMDMGAMGVYTLFGLGDVQLGGMMNKPEEMPVSVWNYYILVDGLDDAMKRATDGGGKVLYGPMDVPGGMRAAMLTDPQGAAFGLLGT